MATNAMQNKHKNQTKRIKLSTFYHKNFLTSQNKLPKTMYTAYSRPLHVLYRSRVLSLQTTFFYLIYGILLRYLLPLIIVWSTDGFWVKEASFRETPTVFFKRQLYLKLEGTFNLSNSTGNSRFNEDNIVSYGYSSWPAINDALKAQNQFIPVTVSDFEDGENQDFKANRLYLHLNIPLNLNQVKVHKVQLLLFFTYALESRVNIKSEMFGLFESESWFPGKSLNFVGTLELHQNRPFPYTGFDLRYNESLLGKSGERLVFEGSEDQTLVNSGPLFTLDNLLDAYYSRDYFTKLTNTRSTWTPFKPGSLSQDPLDNLFTISTTVNYPEKQIFTYETGFWFLLKWAVVQYVAVWILVNWVLEKLEKVVYGDYLLPTVQTLSDLDLLVKIKEKNL